MYIRFSSVFFPSFQFSICSFLSTVVRRFNAYTVHFALSLVERKCVRVFSNKSFDFYDLV